MSNTNVEEDGELRDQLLEMYMKVAKNFYFEGSDPETERNEFGPKFVDEAMQLFAEDKRKAVEEALSLRAFAKEQFGVELTKYQLELLAAWSQDRVMISGRRMGVTTANKVARAYLKRGLAELSQGKESK